MRHVLFLLAALIVLCAAPSAHAGTAEAPEVSDAAGDASPCYGGLGNEYADIVAGWISDETATDFNVNLAISKWEDHLGSAVGFTLQFTHQQMQYGAVASYFPAPVGPGWQYNNGFVDTQTGELSNFTEAEGSFTPGSPAVLTIRFLKSHFPHTEAMDHELKGFVGGSADLKNQVAFFFLPSEVPVDAPDFVVCDTVESDATYTFQVGEHSMGGMQPANATAGGHDAGMHGGNGSAEDVAPLAQANPAGGKDTPAAGLWAIAGATAAALLARRRARLS